MSGIRMLVLFCATALSACRVALTVNVAQKTELGINDATSFSEINAHRGLSGFADEPESFSGSEYREKLAQVLPLLRSMSREQRLATAALIARPGDQLDSKQVSANRMLASRNHFHFSNRNDDF